MTRSTPRTMIANEKSALADPDIRANQSAALHDQRRHRSTRQAVSFMPETRLNSEEQPKSRQATRKGTKNKSLVHEQMIGRRREAPSRHAPSSLAGQSTCLLTCGLLLLLDSATHARASNFGKGPIQRAHNYHQFASHWEPASGQLGYFQLEQPRQQPYAHASHEPVHQLEPSGSRHQHQVSALAQLLPALEAAESQPTGLWSGADLMPASGGQTDEMLGLASGHVSQMASQQPEASRAPSLATPTSPTVSRQLAAPAHFYEIALQPTSALQMETLNEADERRLSFAAHLKPEPPSRTDAGRQLNLTARSNEPSPLGQADGSTSEGRSHPAKIEAITAAEANAAAAASLANEQDKIDMQQSAAIEPRQRRRIFNRILKKAEWNHLFVELSKVFLRYFLDLALKDMIGKQSSSDGTTSRKKLDAQSEIADVLKEFVKTAISNL